MNRIKKILALMLSIALVATTYSVAFAGSNPIVSAQKVDTYRGESVTIDIAIANNPGITSMQLDVSYDKDNLTLTSVTDKGLLKGATLSPTYTVSPYTLSWADDTATENNTSNGTIVTLTFAVKADAPLKEYPITITYNNEDFNIMDKDFNAVDFDVENGSVTVIDKPKENFTGLSFADDTCTYDGEAHTLAVTGLPEGAKAEYTSEDFDKDGKAIDAGTYNITATVTKDGYNDWTETATLTINPKVVTVTGLTAANKAYDGTNTAVLSGGALEGIVARDGEDKLTYSIPKVGTFEDANVGDGKAVTIEDVTLSGSSKDNYTVTQPTGLTANITKAPITIAAKDVTVKVGAKLPSLGYDITVGKLYGEDTVAGELETDCTSTDAEGTFSITQGSLKVSDNYELTFTEGKLSVVDKTPQNITVEGVVTEKTYGDAGFKVTVTPDEASKLDNFTFTSSNTDVAEIAADGTVTIKKVGTTDITVAEAGNEEYAPFERKWTLTVNKKAVTVTANNASKRKGTEDPELTYEVVGEVTKGDIKVTLTRAEGEEIGEYAITVSYEDDANYEVTVKNAVFTIVDKTPQTITVADIAAKTYGDASFELAVTPDSTSKLAAFTYRSDNEKVATVNASGIVVIVGAGKANITVEEPGNEEYAAASVTKELVVAQKDITITAIDLEAKTATFSGVVAGDTVELDFDKLDVKVTNAAEGKAEVSNFVLTGEKAANYNVTNEKLADVAVTVADASDAGVAPEGVTATVKKAEAAKTVIISSIDTTGFEGETLALDATKADATVETVQLPKTAFEALKETDTKLEVKLANGTAVFDKKALEAVAGADGASVSLKITEPDDSRLEDAQVEAKEDLADNKVYSFEINNGTIADFEGGIVTVTVAYTKTGNGSVKVKYLKNDGTTENVSSVKYDADTETVTMELSHFSEYVIYTQPQGSKKPSSSGVVANVGIKNNGEEKPAEEVKEPEETKDPEEQTPAAGKFTDVPAWAEKAVENLSNLGIVSGRGEGKFDPNGKVTRAEFAVMIARMFSLDVADGESTFVDCTKDDWFAPHVNAAAKAGFISGVGEGKFNPSATISRQDICTILGRALKVAATKDLSFADSADIAAYANEYVKAFAELGVVSGYENGTFAPKANASRAEAAAILNNVINLDLEVVKEAIAKLTAAVEK